MSPWYGEEPPGSLLGRRLLTGPPLLPWGLCRTFMVSARKGKGVDHLKAFLQDMVSPPLVFCAAGWGKAIAQAGSPLARCSCP